MPKAQKTKIRSSSRWVLRSVVVLVLVFASFAVFQMVSAQTSQFKDPNCDPLTNPGGCTPSGPLLLSPTDTTTVQVLRTPIIIGGSGVGENRNLGIYGNINLYNGSKLQTSGTFAGQAVSATSTGNHALYGSTSGTGSAGVYGIGTSASSYGLAALNAVGGYALSADGSANNGKAARLVGPTELSNGTNTVTLAVDGTGNLDFQTSVTGKGLTVNGIPVAGGGVQKAMTDTATANQTKDFDVKQYVLNYKAYEVTSVQVLYDDTTTADIQWVPLPTDKYTYRECTSSNFEGKLALTNPIGNSVKYRIIVTYDPQTILPCTSNVPAPTNVRIFNVVNGYWYSGSSVVIKSEATDSTLVNPSGSNISKIEFYDNSVLIGVGQTPPITQTTPGVTMNCGNITTPARKTCNLTLDVDAYLAGLPNPPGTASTWADSTKTHVITTKAYSDGGSTNSSVPATITLKFIKTTEGSACSDTYPTAFACNTTTVCCGSAWRKSYNAGGSCSEVDQGSTIYGCTTPSTNPNPKSGVCGRCSGSG